MAVFRGALHCHSTESDGAESPQGVWRWYQRAGWHFAALTDHRKATPPKLPEDLAGSFTALPGIEYNVSGPQGHVHVNGIGGAVQLEKPEFGGEAKDVLSRLTRHCAESGAFTMINHPNWLWTLAPEDFEGENHAHALEIWNDSKACNNLGGNGRPSAEALWDLLLTKGRRLWATATDDAHVYSAPPQKRIWDMAGGAWVGVQAPDPSPASLLAALFGGDFYSSTGVDLEWVKREQGALSLKVNPMGKQVYRIAWVSTGGRVIRESEGFEDGAQLPEGEAYLRAVVTSSDGERAWTQPVFA